MVMNLSKCIKIFFSLFLCFLLFTGCTGSRHLKDLFIVEGLGIDYYDNNLSVTLQGLKVNVSNASDTPLGNMVVNTSASGTTVSNAINNIAKAVSKRAFFGHNKIIVLSKELAQNDIKNYIDYFLRSEDSRADVAICVSKEKAKFILESKENDANVPSENILFLINNNEETGQSILVNENEFLMLYEDKYSDIYLPVIERKDDESTVKSAGIALFSDNRLAYITNDIETKGFVILNNKAKDVLIQISDEKFGKIDVKLSNIKCKKSASVVENKVYFNVEINADIILNFPDFRAGEKTYQLLTQASGRSGREKKEGEVLIQTYDPDNDAIKKTISDNYEGYYENEMEIRKILKYPPYGRIINIVISSETETGLKEKAEKFYNMIKEKNSFIPKPFKAPIYRINNRYRYQIFIKSDRISINNIKHRIRSSLVNYREKDVRISVDVDPVNLL